MPGAPAAGVDGRVPGVGDVVGERDVGTERVGQRRPGVAVLFDEVVDGVGDLRDAVFDGVSNWGSPSVRSRLVRRCRVRAPRRGLARARS